MEFEGLISSARSGSWGASDVADLARRIASSGQRLSWSQSHTADVASTGGPGSLTTLIPPLHLNALGFEIPKLGVPGRPAGALDALATIPGYRVHLSRDEVVSAMKACGFAHFKADAVFAPLDDALLNHRRATGALSIPALAAASILGKKLAVGVHTVGLDVRVGPFGNFGATWDDAIANATLFADSARLLGLESIIALSEALDSPQPWIGRGETLVALASALGLRPLADTMDWLARHVADCKALTNEFVRRTPVPPRVRADVNESFRGHLRAQGTTFERFEERLATVLGSRLYCIEAVASGALKIDVGTIRDVLVAAQKAEDTEYADPAGIVLQKPAGAMVAKGDTLALLRVSSNNQSPADLITHLSRAFTVSPATATNISPRFEILDA